MHFNFLYIFQFPYSEHYNLHWSWCFRWLFNKLIDRKSVDNKSFIKQKCKKTLACWSLSINIWMEAQPLTHVCPLFFLCTAREREKAARYCGRCADSCCWNWLPSCHAHGARTCPTTVTWKRAAQGTLASERSMWWKPALCSDCTVLSWALQASGR